MRPGTTLVEVMAVLAMLAIIVLIAVGVVHQVRHRYDHGVVLERSHVPSTTGTGFTSSGKLVVTSTSEEWDLIVRHDAGDVASVRVTAEEWASHPAGSEWGNAVQVERP